MLLCHFGPTHIVQFWSLDMPIICAKIEAPSTDKKNFTPLNTYTIILQPKWQNTPFAPKVPTKCPCSKTIVKCPCFKTRFSKNQISVRNLSSLKNFKWNSSSIIFFFFFKVWLPITRLYTNRVLHWNSIFRKSSFKIWAYR